jgi:predicted metal-binding protein
MPLSLPLQYVVTELNNLSEKETYILQKISALGAEEIGVTLTSSLRFDSGYRKYCIQNLCGNYNRSWTCPPNCETPEAIAALILSYQKAFLFTVSGPLRFHVDWKSMMKVADRLNKICSAITDIIIPVIGNGQVFGYGPCRYCENCTFKTQEPCRFPDKRIRSMECACIDAVDALKHCGLKLKFNPDLINFSGLYVCTFS